TSSDVTPYLRRLRRPSTVPPPTAGRVSRSSRPTRREKLARQDVVPSRQKTHEASLLANVTANEGHETRAEEQHARRLRNHRARARVRIRVRVRVRVRIRVRVDPRRIRP